MRISWRLRACPRIVRLTSIGCCSLALRTDPQILGSALCPRSRPGVQWLYRSPNVSAGCPTVAAPSSPPPVVPAGAINCLPQLQLPRLVLQISRAFSTRFPKRFHKRCSFRLIYVIDSCLLCAYLQVSRYNNV